ncbi:winged helix-turn-helix domain-containing protein (plasmid) [Pseudomonas sp. A1437]|uniref:winged helix-turn-helix domain-containing protein n=1 Tax=Pseudomonas sp. A1437 TaxID=3235107 RepID=UPI00378315F3
MKTIDKILALQVENPDITNSEAAEALKLSRQRVSQECKKAGVTLSRAYGRKTGIVTPPAPRVITGGIPTRISHTVCGTISELLVAADLMARGYKPYFPFVRQRAHDIIAVAPCGEILTFEVRSGKRRADGEGYTFLHKGDGMESDHYAIVLTGDPVIYSPELDPAKENPKALYKAKRKKPQMTP